MRFAIVFRRLLDVKRRICYLKSFQQLRNISVSGSLSEVSVGGFPTRLKRLLVRREWQVPRGSLLEVCSSEALSKAKLAILDVTGVDVKGTAPETIANNLCTHYNSLDDVEDRKAFFLVLADSLAVDHEKIVDKAQHLISLQSQQRNESAFLKCEASLRYSLSPFYMELFSLIARLESGIKFLVDMRGDLLTITRQLQESGTSTYLLTEMSNNLKGILANLFNLQLLDLQKITWESPCDLVEKISTYEAVHPLRDWKDLKHRLGTDRRCFAFMHKALPHEPIVILHAALTNQPSSSIQTLLNRKHQEDLENISTANFYSISVTHKGLSGIELGNFLIKRVVQELQREFPNRLSTFVTLSPIPGFRKWLDAHLKMNITKEDKLGVSLAELEPLLPFFPASSSPIEALVQALNSSSKWLEGSEEKLADNLQSPLTKLCARYLAVVKRRGHAIDPVAHFHLQNGASIWRLNWRADISSKGMERSYGLMVNYHYNLLDISQNSDAYSISGTIAQSDSFSHWLK